MTDKPAQRSASASNVITVPRSARPRLGPNPIPLDLVCQRAQEAFDASADAFKGELAALIKTMVAIDTGESPHFQSKSLVELMKRANDVRGVAATLGSELTADVANAIFELAEGALPNGSLPRPLILLLAQSGLRLIGYRRSADGGQCHRHVQELLMDVRAKIANRAPPPQ